MSDNPVWAEKYRPKTVEESILPAAMKATFQAMVDKGALHENLLLVGPAGVGKTTVAKAMLEQLGADYMVINGSLNGNIDTLRNDILHFASSISFRGGRKYVIIDEADYLNQNSTQPALRNFMEEYSKNCGFIMTANYANRIIEPLRSRCSVITFQNPKEEAGALAKQFFMRALGILDKEGIQYEKKVVAEVVKRFYPDWRKVLNELQRYSKTGRIDAGIFVNFSEENFKLLIQALKSKNFNDMRKWVGENTDMDAMVIYRKLYDTAYDYLQPASIPPLVVTLARYQDMHTRVVDTEINLAACLTEIMVESDFK